MLKLVDPTPLLIGSGISHKCDGCCKNDISGLYEAINQIKVNCDLTPVLCAISAISEQNNQILCQNSTILEQNNTILEKINDISDKIDKCCGDEPSDIIYVVHDKGEGPSTFAGSGTIVYKTDRDLTPLEGQTKTLVFVGKTNSPLQVSVLSKNGSSFPVFNNNDTPLKAKDVVQGELTLSYIYADKIKINVATT